MTPIKQNSGLLVNYTTALIASVFYKKPQGERTDHERTTTASSSEGGDSESGASQPHEGQDQQEAEQQEDGVDEPLVDHERRESPQNYHSNCPEARKLPRSVFFIRHAQSKTNSGVKDLPNSAIAYAWGDPGLSDKGLNEVRHLRRAFNDWATWKSKRLSPVAAVIAVATPATAGVTEEQISQRVGEGAGEEEGRCVSPTECADVNDKQLSNQSSNSQVLLQPTEHQPADQQQPVDQQQPADQQQPVDEQPAEHQSGDQQQPAEEQLDDLPKPCIPSLHIPSQLKSNDELAPPEEFHSSSSPPPSHSPSPSTSPPPSSSAPSPTPSPSPSPYPSSPTSPISGAAISQVVTPIDRINLEMNREGIAESETKTDKEEEEETKVEMKLEPESRTEAEAESAPDLREKLQPEAEEGEEEAQLKTETETDLGTELGTEPELKSELLSGPEKNEINSNATNENEEDQYETKNSYDDDDNDDNDGNDEEAALSFTDFLSVEEIDVLILSPLSRALETSNILFDLETRIHRKNFPRCVVNPLCREAVHSRADLGSYREHLENRFPHLNDAFKALPDSKWWYDSWGLPSLISYHEDDISPRLQDFSDYLLHDDFSGKNIVVVGHSEFFQQFLGTETKLRNCGVVKVRFDCEKGRWMPDFSDESVFGEEQFNDL